MAMFKGATVSTVSIAIFSVLGLPILIELGVSIVIVGLVRKKLLDNQEVETYLKSKLDEIETSDIIDRVKSNFITFSTGFIKPTATENDMDKIE